MNRLRKISAYFYRKRGFKFEFTDLSLDDAREYFLVYYPRLCNKGELSLTSLKAELSTAKSFGAFIEKVRDEAIKQGKRLPPYSCPFFKIVSPHVDYALHSEILSDEEMDLALFNAKQTDLRLYMIFVLSLRMMLMENVILSLKKDMINVFYDGQKKIGTLSYVKNSREYYKKIPDDILEELLLFSEGKDYLFVNKAGNPLTSANLRVLLKNLSDITGFKATPKQFRTKALLDIVQNNPDEERAVSEFAGLSERSIKGYASALDRFSFNNRIADSSSYRILTKTDA